MKQKIITLLSVSVITLILLLSCSKKDSEGAPLPQPKDSVQNINRWILDSMLHYYLWSDEIRQYPSLAQNPDNFFRQLLNTEDRFSWISNGAGISPSKSTYDKYGFHYILVDQPASAAGNLIGIITLATPGSPADRAGLSRGDYFTRVNNQLITAQNSSTAVDMLKETSSVKLTRATLLNNIWTENPATTISSGYYEERPVFSKKIFSRNNISTGYIFYNNFNELFDKDILDVLDSMKAHAVQELIIDLRYNSGGSVATAAKISATIPTTIEAVQNFARFKGNSRWGNFDQTFEKAISSSSNAYKRSFTLLRSSGLNLNRIFVLSGNNTASAAEMIINNLKPYVSVIHIGETTQGKDKAGILIKDLRQPKQVSWYMQPMVFRIFNANDQGNYSSGLVPQYPVSEYSILPLQNIGSSQDLLISKALVMIYGTDQVDTESLRLKKQDSHRLQPDALKYNSFTQQHENLVQVNVNNF